MKFHWKNNQKHTACKYASHSSRQSACKIHRDCISRDLLVMSMVALMVLSLVSSMDELKVDSKGLKWVSGLGVRWADG